MEVHLGSSLDREPIFSPSVSYMTTDVCLNVRFLQSISYKPTICEILSSSLVQIPPFFVRSIYFFLPTSEKTRFTHT